MSKRKNKQKLNTAKNEKLLSRLRIILLAALMIIIFYPPYLQGLFFEKHVLPTQIFVFLVFILFMVYKWLKKDYTFFKTPIDYIALGFVVVYFISIFVAVHTRSAIIEWMKYGMYFAVFYMLSDLADNLKTKLLVLWTIVASAVGSSILGLDAAMGGNLVSFVNRIFRALGAENDVFFGLFVGNRIHSTLQYPNAMASYVMAVFLITAGLLMISKKLWQKVVTSGLAYILFLTFMLTQSRGAQILFPVAVVVFVLIMQKGNRIKTFTQIVILAIPAVVISLLINPHLSVNTLNSKAILLVFTGLVISVVFGVISEFLGNMLQKVNWKVYVSIFSVFIILIIVVTIHVINASVPAELSLDITEDNRTQSISKNVALKPNREYILSYEAEAGMETEQNYAYFVRLFSLNENNILFGGNNLLLRENFMETEGVEENRVSFITTEDTKLIRIIFSNHFSGTHVKVDNVKILDAETGKEVKKVILKNKYNLDNIISRFQNLGLSSSVITRTIFYKDGLRIYASSWLFGSGGGAWDYLYRQYQSYNYSSSQAHNFPLQLGIETGILGIIVLCSLVFFIFIISIRHYKKTKEEHSSKKIDGKVYNSEIVIKASIIAAISALFIHSLIDFDFSEAAMLLLFWQLIALFNNEIKKGLTFKEMLPFSVKENRVINKKRKEYKKISVVAGILITTIALILTSNFQIASAHANKAFRYLQDDNMEEAIRSMNKAIDFDSFNERYVIGYNPVPSRPDIKIGLVDLLFTKNDIIQNREQRGEETPENELRILQQQLTEANDYILRNEKRATNNLNLTSNMASYCFRTGQTDKGIDYLDKAISMFPFEPSLWHSKVDIYFQLMSRYYNQEDYENAKTYINLGFNIINEAKDSNTKNMNPFVFNKNTIELLQKMRFIEDYWGQEELRYLNEITHYTLADLDVDNDNIPDQWRSANTDVLNATIDNGNIHIKATGRSYISTRYFVKFEQGKTYRIRVKLKEPIDYLTYYISSIKGTTPFTQEVNEYIGEFLVEKEPNKNGNQLRIFMETDCTIESIYIKEVT